MGKKLKSIFTDDMNTCYFTGSNLVERHHIFGGANRPISEIHGFVIPLDFRIHKEIHGQGNEQSRKFIKDMTGLSGKQMYMFLRAYCQRAWMKFGGTEELFLEQFGRLYINEETEEQLKERNLW